VTTTEAPPSRRRALGGWAIIVVVLVGVGLVGVVIAGLGQWRTHGPLDPESAGPDGTRALAEILRDRGVGVSVVRDRATAERRAAEPGTTLVLPDDPTLSDDAFSRLAAAADDVVVPDPHARGIRLLFPGARPAGVGPAAPVAPGCGLPEAERAGSIVPGAVFAPAGGAVACYPAEGGHALLVSDADGRRIAAIDGGALFDNAHLAENGNAALAIGLLGRTPSVVWFVPDLADSDLAPGDATLGDVTPPWVTPAIALLLVAVLAAALWRGRRFGPLVAESLPVSVRANETAEGRARLYARSRDAAHAAHALRAGTLARLRTRLGLGAAADAGAVASAAASRTGLPLPRVRALLVDEPPTDDRALLALAEGLDALESAADAASRPERNTP